jgi:cell division protein DivIC
MLYYYCKYKKRQAGRMRKGEKAFKYFKVLLFLIVALFLVRVAQQGYTIYKVNLETEKTQEKVRKLEQEQKALQQEKQNLDNLKYIEKLAREEHNMVRKGEIPLFIIEDKDKKATDGKINDAAQK